ncbi:MAG: metallophosphatase domain-containing protein [Microscillaceae bacterium]|jgi:Icc-related predicted phosphoesterase|nr:metallophosphatase domain-containing protein [Microscillaceae bacterium]
MKLVCLSDTHTHHRRVEIPVGDILIFAGDICHKGKDLAVIQDFNAWLGELPHRHKIVIAGNHDHLLEKDPQKIKDWLSNAIYLEDSGIELNGLKIWGSPVTPWFLGMAFNVGRGRAIREHWNKIPYGTDILITHGPPKGVLDRAFWGIQAGCRDLYNAVMEVKPKVHIFGHIHERHGAKVESDIRFYNVSIMDAQWQPNNPATVIQL